MQVEQVNNQLTLLAPNRFVMDWVRKNYLPRIIETIDLLDDSKSLTVSISIGSLNNLNNLSESTASKISGNDGSPQADT